MHQAKRGTLAGGWYDAAYTVLLAVGVGRLLEVFLALLDFALRGKGGAGESFFSRPLPMAAAVILSQAAFFGIAVNRTSAEGLCSRKGDQLRPLDWRFGLAGVGLVLGVAPGANGLAMAVARRMGVDLVALENVQKVLVNAGWLEFALLGIVLTTIPAIVEELLFRGVVMGALAEARPMASLTFQAFGFAVFHWDWAQGMATFCLGMVFGALRRFSQSLWVPMLAHGVYNLVVVLSTRVLGDHEPSSVEATIEIGVGLWIAFVSWGWLTRLHGRAKGEP